MCHIFNHISLFWLPLVGWEAPANDMFKYGGQLFRSTKFYESKDLICMSGKLL